MPASPKRHARSPNAGCESLNWVDLAVVAVAVVSGLLGLARGFVRESLGVGAWVGAGFVAVKAAPLVQDRFAGWLGSADLASPVAHGAIFVGTLILFSLLAGWVASLAQAAGLGAVDRSLGAMFGVLRGYALVVLVYVLAGFLQPAAKWPDVVRAARLLGYVADSAAWVTAQLPANFRPTLPSVTTEGPSLPRLLQAVPAGKARP